jgi:hypothetical protein
MGGGMKRVSKEEPPSPKRKTMIKMLETTTK